MDLQDAPEKDVTADVAWACAGRERERRDREDCGPGVRLHTPKQWAARAYLRATGEPSEPSDADALLKRIEVAQEMQAGRPAETMKVFRKRFAASMKAARKRPRPG